MQRVQSATLIYATLVLAVAAAILSCTSVRLGLDTYFASDRVSPWASVTRVIGDSMADDPANPVAALEWRVPLGN